MKIISKKQWTTDETILLKDLAKGKIVVYPTDTIYGIGCDATNEEAVSKIRAIKKRQETPLSIIAPNKAWILQHCILQPEHKVYLEKLPGPYTLIVPLKDSAAVAFAVNHGSNTVGVRVPAHWFASVVKKLGKPFITTSVNYHGQPPIQEIKEIPALMQEQIDFAIDDGLCSGSPSTLIDLTEKKVRVKKR